MRPVVENASLMRIDTYPKSLVLLLLIVALLKPEVRAQNNIPLGTWRMHISYRHSFDVAIGNNQIFCASSNGIFYYSKVDNSINTLSKLNGLSDSGITEIGYSEEKDLLLIGYQNGNLDFLTESKLINFPTIKETDLSQKTINHSFFSGNTAFISTDFGVLLFDMNRMDIIESYLNLGKSGEMLQINNGVIYHDTLFLATKEGVIAGSLDPSINLKDYNNWRRFIPSDGIANLETNSLAVSRDTLYAAISMDGIYKYIDGSWLKEEQLQNTLINNISADSEWLTVSTDSSIWFLMDNMFVEMVSGTIAPRIALYDSQNALWIADFEQGLRTNFEGAFMNIKPNGPHSDNIFKLFNNDDLIIGLSGGYDDIGNSLDDNSGFFVFDNGSWENYFNPDIELPSDLVDIDFNAVNQKYIITSFSDGYVEWDGGDLLNWVDQGNQDYPFSTNKLAAINFSDKFWISAYDTQPSVYSQGSDGNWMPVNLNQPGESYILEIESDPAGNIWFRIDPNKTGGMIFYDIGQNSTKFLSNGNGNGGLPNNQVNDLEVDLDGNVWVATDKGVAYYPYGSIQSDRTADAIRPVFDGRFLFSNEKVNVICTDGGNRKWMGTENGLWLFNEFGDELIRHFTVDNSPLLSNTIIDIKVNSKSGEVFISTDQGTSSFRSDATAGRDTHAPEIKIYPNPVTSSFNGIVGFEGLAANALVKITDVSGRLVWQMQANGGTASWNLSTVYGGRPTTGIYLVFSSTEEGSDSYVGKFAIIE